MNLISPIRRPFGKPRASDPVRSLVCGLILCLPSVVVHAADRDLPSVVSTNLCADLLLMQIGDPQQIASLSTAAADPRLSPLAVAAQDYPANRGTVEELLHLRPDLVLVYRGWNGRGHAGLLAEQGVRVEPLSYPTNWDDALRIARDSAALIGRGDAASAIIAQAEQRMQRLAARTPPLRVLYLRPSGGSAGSGTYVDDLLQRLGLRNLAAEAGLHGWGRFPLELLVAGPPDLFMLGYFDAAEPLARTRFARHPLLRELLERTPGLALPAGTWGCGGLELVEVAEQIVAQIEALPDALVDQPQGTGQGLD